ncbi:MAG: dTMP kinase [Kiritimatiellia bacterium]|nr:dTMP kinase [Kiritimatiellia bacterium]
MPVKTHPSVIPDAPAPQKSKSPRRGTFISLEGPEGCGKSTQVRRLIDKLKTLGKWTVEAREPGGTATGEAIRNILQHDLAGEPIGAEAETLLFEASRAQLCRRVILPALEAGAWVISDRFFDSTTAYQGYGRKLPVGKLLVLHAFAVCGAVPDLTLLLDIDVETGFQRLQKRQKSGGVGPDRMEREERAFHERVREGYLALAKKWPQRIRVIDASKDPDDVFGAIWREIENAGRLTD